jgi:uncharacterized 2Fe-2S/4Fe-4S cluster protein (DUF4445 family)
VTFLPGGRRTEVADGTTLHAAACEAGMPLVAPCGGNGRCGRCVVEVRGDAPTPSGFEQKCLSTEDLASGRRLACQLKIDRDMEVLIPRSSRPVFTEILSDGECVTFPMEPAVRVRELVLEEPTLEDNTADLQRLTRGPREHLVAADLDVLRELPRVLRGNAFGVKTLARGSMLLEVLPPGEVARTLGVAFDIGTTTVAGALLDLATGETLSVTSRTNPQHALGDDVISRMDHAAKGGAELAELRSCMVECLNDMTGELCREAGAGTEDVYDIVVAGNTVMTHLFLGLPPEAMATVPFVPVTTSSVGARATEVELKASRHAHVMSMPAISAYVGGDIVAGLVAIGLAGFAEETIFIDIGTNGEVVAGSGERAVCAATAAGPAFEGARISCGMRAVPGAITHAWLEGGNLRYEVIGGGPPAGLCGTGLVDVVACLLETGVIDETGRMEAAQETGLSARVREGDGGPEFVLWAEGEGEGEREVVLRQRDVRELQLAKGAICAGAMVLLDEIGVAPADVHGVLLAGAFGSTIDPRSAVRIGLLPTGIAPERVRAVGNTAAAGARAALASASARREAQRVARWLRPVELSLHARFQESFAESMLFPTPGRVNEAVRLPVRARTQTGTTRPGVDRPREGAE